MKTISAGAAILALTICLGSPAMAQGRDQHDRGDRPRADRPEPRMEQRHGSRDDGRHARRDERRDHRADHRQDRRDDRWDRRVDRRVDRRDERFERRHDRRDDARGQPFYAPNHYPPARAVYRHQHGWRGAGPNHNFYRGGRLPPHYRSHHYVVSNWRAHHLSPPPRGYHWVQTGPDYVLAAIATGVILQIFLGG